MNFYLTSDNFEKLKKASSGSKKEITGELVFAKKGTDYGLSKIDIYDNNDRNFVQSASKRDVIINYETFLQRVLFEAYSSSNKDGVVVRFHSHPTNVGSKGLACPSDGDQEFMKSMQSSLNILNNKLGKNFTYVEGIITDSEIGFYYFDGTVKRVNTFIDFVEHIPKQPDKRNLRQVFADGFRSGRKR